MDQFTTMTYERTDRVARITLNRPERGNGITLAMPVNQLVMMKLLVNQSTPGLLATQILGTVFDGVSRHSVEGYAFQRRAQQAGFKQAVRERDEPFGDFGPSTFKG
jgi:1,4-dihydroxy-2-naphthoyl-CoA synthase